MSAGPRTAAGPGCGPAASGAGRTAGRPTPTGGRRPSSSARERATKFHHIRIGSPNGSPPSSSTRAGSSADSTSSLAALAQVGQLARPDHLVVDQHLARPGRPGRARRPAPAARRPSPACRAASTPTSAVSRRAGDAAPAKLPTRTVADGVVQLDPRQLGVVRERGRAVAGRLRLGHPQLHAVELAAVAAGRLLGVGDAVPGGHQVELPGPDDLLAAEAVAVQDLAGDQPGDRVQAGVRVRADIQTLGLGDQLRPHVVGEAPGPHGPSLPAGERPPHRHRPRRRPRGWA